MSELTIKSMDTTLENRPVEMPIGAGAMLRSAREAQGLHIAMLAVALKVPVKKLEALEADQYDLLPDTVFVRALASSVCRALKIDVAPVLSALPPSHAPKIKTDESGLNATFNDSARGSGNALLSQMSKPLSISILLLVVGIFAIVFIPSRTLHETTSVAQQADVSMPTTVPAAVQESPPPVASPVLPTAVSSVAFSDSVNVGAPSQTPILVPASPSVTAPLSSEVTTVISDMSVLTLHAHGPSWVEVIDAKGVRQLRKTLIKDEILPVAGALPLAVILGRADLVSVTVRGQPFDALALSKDNVARFEVK